MIIFEDLAADDNHCQQAGNRSHFHPSMLGLLTIPHFARFSSPTPLTLNA
jgi:hypothetical protein